jgi:hypothetical protein
MGCCCGKNRDPENVQPLIGSEQKVGVTKGSEAQEMEQGEKGNNGQVNPKTNDENKEAASKKKATEEQSDDAIRRLEAWENKRKMKLDRNKTTRRLSGEMENGNWAKIVNKDEVGKAGNR